MHGILLFVELQKHAFLAEKMQAMLNLLWMHCDTHAQSALKCFNDVCNGADLLFQYRLRNDPDLLLDQVVDVVMYHIICIINQGICINCHAVDRNQIILETVACCGLIIDFINGSIN